MIYDFPPARLCIVYSFHFSTKNVNLPWSNTFKPHTPRLLNVLVFNSYLDCLSSFLPLTDYAPPYPGLHMFLPLIDCLSSFLPWTAYVVLSPGLLMLLPLLECLAYAPPSPGLLVLISSLD